ncbi:unnamed protein product [Colias eurytheme]|nr:unnamed protein product [Colias eurytheme]
MEQKLELFLLKIDEKLEKQAELITLSVTKNVMEVIDQKMKTIIEENNNLKTKISELEQKLKLAEKDKRKSNLVFFGIEEKGKSEKELVEEIGKIIEDMGVQICISEICNVYRIGHQIKNKNRPVVVTIASLWKKHLILINKPKLPPSINIKEDFPKEILEKRKQLQPLVEEEKKKGNIAYIKYDKLIVKKPKENREKRKRESSDSPKTQKKSYTKESFKNRTPTQLLPKTQPRDIVRPNILNYVERARSDPQLNTSKN